MSGAELMRYGQDPDGFPIDLNRPKVAVPGGMGTEFSQTDEHNGRFYNYPRVWGGKLLSPDDAYDQFRRALSEGNWVYPNYPTLESAEAAAVRRSKHIGKLRGM